MTITTDAHAQTNTERLATVEDNTNSIIAALSGISDAIANGFAAVMEALGAIQTDVDTIHDEVETLHSEVDSIVDDVAATQTGLEDIGNAVAGLDDKIDTMSMAVSGAVATLGQPDPEVAQILQGVAANRENIGALSNALTNINERLDMISNAVGTVNTTTSNIQEAVATSDDGTTTALSELHSVEVEYGVPVSAFGNNKATDAVYKADLKLECESPVFIDTVTTDIGTATTATDGSEGGVFSPNAETPNTAKASVIANGMTVYNTQFKTGSGAADVGLYSAGASFNLAELAAGSSLTIKLSTDRTTALVAGPTSAETSANKSFTIMTYLNADARDRITNTADAAGGTNTTKATAGKVEVFTLTTNLYSSAEDPKCTVTPPAGPSVDYAQTDQTVSFAINAPETETRSIKTITDRIFSCSGATAITKVSLEGGLIADFQTFVDLTLSAATEKSLSFKKVADTAVLEAVFDEPFEITSGDVTLSGKIPGSAALVSVTYDTVADAKCSVPTS